MSVIAKLQKDYQQKLHDSERLPIEFPEIGFKCHVVSVIPQGRSDKIRRAVADGANIDPAVIINTLRYSEGDDDGKYIFEPKDMKDFATFDKMVVERVALDIISVVPWLKDNFEDIAPSNGSSKGTVSELEVAEKNS